MYKWVLELCPLNVLCSKYLTFCVVSHEKETSNQSFKALSMPVNLEQGFYLGCALIVIIWATLEHVDAWGRIQTCSRFAGTSSL